MKIDDLLLEMVERKASDIFLKVNSPPCIRVDGTIEKMDYADLTHDDIKDLTAQMTTEKQREIFENYPELDIAYHAKGVGRFRVNIFRQRGTYALVMRSILEAEQSFEELNLPPAVQYLSEMQFYEYNPHY